MLSVTQIKVEYFIGWSFFSTWSGVGGISQLPLAHHGSHQHQHQHHRLFESLQVLYSLSSFLLLQWVTLTTLMAELVSLHSAMFYVLYRSCRKPRSLPHHTGTNGAQTGPSLYPLFCSFLLWAHPLCCWLNVIS